MLTKLPAQNKIAAFDIDAQNTFTPEIGRAHV